MLTKPLWFVYTFFIQSGFSYFCIAFRARRLPPGFRLDQRRAGLDRSMENIFLRSLILFPGALSVAFMVWFFVMFWRASGRR
jgi:hypothetical protein